MGRTANYLVAQHVSDPFRNEPRNIGVLIDIGGERVAKFVGEITPGKIDGKRVRFMTYPDVYRQWVGRWWDMLTAGADWAALIASSKEHYRVIEGGEVNDIGDDSAFDVANYLFASLVSEGNFATALGGDDDVQAAPLKDDISKAMIEAAVLIDDNIGASNVPHPVRRDVSIQGKIARHRPAFSQDTGRLVVMDAVDLTTPKVALAKERSGFLAFMFADIHEVNTDTDAISVVRVQSEDKKNPNVEYALSMLGATSRIVDWLSDNDRAAFLDERIKLARNPVAD